MNTCPVCNTDNEDEAFMGVLGSWAQIRCRYCGAWWAVALHTLTFDNLEIDDD